MDYPIMVAPTAYQLQLHPEGEVAMRHGATSASNTPMIISGNASLPVPKIAAAESSSTVWYQIYPNADLAASQDLIENAQTAGCKAVVMTVDQQSSSYERATHNRNLGPFTGRGVAGRGGRGGPAGGRGGNPY